MANFDDIIRNAQQDAALKRVVELNSLQAHETEKARLAALAEKNLSEVVLPLMKMACDSVKTAGTAAFIEQGVDPTSRFPSVILQITQPTNGYPPALIFEAETISVAPALGYRIEEFEPHGIPLNKRILDPTPETISEVISEFLGKVFAR